MFDQLDAPETPPSDRQEYSTNLHPQRDFSIPTNEYLPNMLVVISGSS